MVSWPTWFRRCPPVPATQPDRTVGRHFFGRVHALTSATLQTAGLAECPECPGRLQESAWSLPANGATDWGSIETRGFRLRIPGIDGVPARGLPRDPVLFSVIIGPVSFWFLWRRRQRVLLVLTAPHHFDCLHRPPRRLRSGGRRLRRVWPGGDVHHPRRSDETGRDAGHRLLYAAGMTPSRRPALRPGCCCVPDRCRGDRDP